MVVCFWDGVCEGGGWGEPGHQDNQCEAVLVHLLCKRQSNAAGKHV